MFDRKVVRFVNLHTLLHVFQFLEIFELLKEPVFPGAWVSDISESDWISGPIFNKDQTTQRYQQNPDQVRKDRKPLHDGTQPGVKPAAQDGGEEEDIDRADHETLQADTL